MQPSHWETALCIALRLSGLGWRLKRDVWQKVQIWYTRSGSINLLLIPFRYQEVGG